MEGLPEREAAAAASSQVTRVFIGGLSVSVTSADIEKTFAALGRVNSVELVRNNDRRFAFMDFEPNSDKALAKLFATYNGCTWKGGRLRLEKAKEHYLARLKKEWAEDAKLATAVNLDMKKDAELPTAVNLDMKKEAGYLKMSERLNQEKMQLRIFFPTLRKVKALPFKGTGKHKYSFQRFEAPPLPINFCDCEEHYELSKMSNQDYLSSLNKAAYEKERSIMTSVMNKLFEKEEDEMAVSGMTKLAKNEHTMGFSNNDVQVKEREEIQEADADNLVTNIEMGQSNDMLAPLRGRDQESRFAKLKSVKNKLSRNKAHSQKQQGTAFAGTSEVALNQESGPQVAGKTIEDEFTSILPRSEVPEGCQQSETVTEAPVLNNQTELERSTLESTRSKSWIQKSSWKDLVGGLGNTSFSISNVLPDISSLEKKLPDASDRDTITSAASKKRKVQSEVEGSPLAVKRNIRQKQVVAPALDQMLQKGDRNKAVVEDGSGEPQENGQQQHKRIIPKVNIGEVCTFMRSAESEKQWTMAKSTLSRYLNKNNQNKDSKLLKGMSAQGQ